MHNNGIQNLNDYWRIRCLTKNDYWIMKRITKVGLKELDVEYQNVKFFKMLLYIYTHKLELILKTIYSFWIKINIFSLFLSTSLMRINQNVNHAFIIIFFMIFIY